MRKFKSGDNIKRVGASWANVVYGNTYTVDKYVNHHCMTLMQVAGSYLDDEFELVSEAPKQTGGIKHDADKVDFALVPVHPHTEVARVWTFGKKKYDAWNWKKGFIWSRPYAAALRHIYAWARGESNDPETGMPHLAHAICCLMMLIEFEHKGIGEDDRQKEFDEFAEAKRLRAKQEELCAKYDELVYFDESSPYPPKPTPGQFLKRTSNKGNDNE